MTFDNRPEPLSRSGTDLGTLPPVSGKDFRDCIARLPSGVHVVTTDGPAGRGGFTATAVASVSDDPPTVLVCLNRRSAQADLFAENGRFAVNLMRAGTEPLADVFAGREGHTPAERFGAGEWTTIATGAPVLAGAVMTLDCRLVHKIVVATHLVFFGEVVGTAMAPRTGGADVLVYHDRHYAAV